jgi:uncharacterized protein (DUF983 family)
MAAPSSPPRIFGPALTRSLRRRCPRCGEGALFASTFKLRERCEVCDLVLRKEPGAMTGQMYLSAAVTEVFAAGLIFAVVLFTDWGPALSIAVGLPIVIAFSYWLLPRAMAFWVGVEYATDAANAHHAAASFERSEGPRD